MDLLWWLLGVLILVAGLELIFGFRQRRHIVIAKAPPTAPVETPPAALTDIIQLPHDRSSSRGHFEPSLPPPPNPLIGKQVAFPFAGEKRTGKVVEIRGNTARIETSECGGKKFVERKLSEISPV